MLFEKMKKVPLILKLILGGIPVFIVVIRIYVMRSEGSQNGHMFFQKGFSSIIVSSNTFEGGRSEEFRLSNGLKLYFLPSIEEKIAIGDSIKKEEDTYRYSVYRKDIYGRYKLIANYDFSHIQ